jgi:hypothetical protein
MELLNSLVQSPRRVQQTKYLAMTSLAVYLQSHNATKMMDAEAEAYSVSYSSSCSFLPPLDQVTVCSETDSSDLSSVSSDDDEGEVFLTKTRSIFGDYWGKKGGAPTLRRGHDQVAMRQSGRVNDDFNSVRSSVESINTYEHVLKVQEEEKAKPLRCPASCRRTIFHASNAYSTPSFRVGRSNDKNLIRKTRSASALQKEQTSILRQSRFTAMNSPSIRRRSDSDPTVTFRAEVDVLVFQPPLEVFAKKGWSKHFV